MKKMMFLLLLVMLTVSLNARGQDTNKHVKNKKPTSSKKHYFKFIDTFAEIEKKKKEQVFKYENQSRFQFKFQSSLSEGANIVNPGGGAGSGAGVSSAGSAGGGIGGAAGGGGHGGGGQGNGAGGRR